MTSVLMWGSKPGTQTVLVPPCFERKSLHEALRRIEERLHGNGAVSEADCVRCVLSIYSVTLRDTGCRFVFVSCSCIQWSSRFIPAAEADKLTLVASCFK